MSDLCDRCHWRDYSGAEATIRVGQYRLWITGYTNRLDSLNPLTTPEKCLNAFCHSSPECRKRLSFTALCSSHMICWLTVDFQKSCNLRDPYKWIYYTCSTSCDHASAVLEVQLAWIWDVATLYFHLFVWYYTWPRPFDCELFWTIINNIFLGWVCLCVFAHNDVCSAEMVVECGHFWKFLVRLAYLLW